MESKINFNTKQISDDSISILDIGVKGCYQSKCRLSAGSEIELYCRGGGFMFVKCFQLNR